MQKPQAAKPAKKGFTPHLPLALLPSRGSPAHIRSIGACMRFTAKGSWWWRWCWQRPFAYLEEVLFPLWYPGAVFDALGQQVEALACAHPRQGNGGGAVTREHGHGHARTRGGH